MTQHSAAPRIPRPEVVHGSDWRFPLPRVETLDNGLQVWAFDLPGQHVAAMDLVQPIALDVEDRDKEGVANLALRASDEGTQRHPDGRISELLENVGAAYNGRVSHGHTTSSLDFPMTRFEAALPLFAEITATPAYDPRDVARHQALRVAELEQALVNGGQSATMAVRQLRWAAGTRSSRMVGGTRRSVSAITAEDVAAFHAAHWGPEGSVVVLAGDFGIDVFSVLNRTLGAWRGTTRPRVQSSLDQFAPLPSTRTIKLVDRPGAVQIDLRIAGIGVDRHDPDWPALQVASVAVGGSFLSRLNRVIREELGYTYGIQLSAHPQRRGGTWTVSANIRNEVAAAAIDETLRLLDLSARPLEPEEIEDAVNQVVGVAPLHYDTAEAIVGQASALAAAGVDADQVNRHHENLRRVTPESATAAHQRLIGSGRGHVVVVGDAERLTGPLEAAGYMVESLELDA